MMGIRGGLLIMRRALVVSGLALMLVPAACTTSTDPPVSLVVGLRVLAVTADPPEVAPGATSQVAALVVDTAGRPVDASWSRCTLPPRTGEAVNPGCVTATGAPTLVPVGAGLSIAATMPDVTAAMLGQPDATGGVYLPLVAQISDGADAVTTVYRLRLAGAGPPNTNPAIASVDVVDMAGASTPIDPAAPLVVHAGQALTLAATFAPGSAEAYTRPGGAAATETLTTSWFATDGAFSVDKTSASQPQTVLTLGKNPANPGQNIDLWAVGHDERGGVGYTHRVLELQ
jgi:hypothetical protein